MENNIDSDQFDIIFSSDFVVVHGFLTHDDSRNDEDDSFSDETNIAPDMMDSVCGTLRDSGFTNIGHVESHDDNCDDTTNVENRFSNVEKHVTNRYCSVDLKNLIVFDFRNNPCHCISTN